MGKPKGPGGFLKTKGTEMNKQRTIVKEQVKERIITMRAGFKNAADGEKDKTIGILILAKELEIITGQEFLDGIQWAKAEHTARNMKNVTTRDDKYDKAAMLAYWEFEKHFQA